MTEQSQQNKDLQDQPSPKEAAGALDAAGSSLFEAMRVSFIILKVIMMVLVVLFLASGFRTVGSDEQALVLRFGKIRGVGDQRILGPGLHWVFPYPIDTIVKIPVEKRTNLPINSFWYFQKREETLPEGLKPQIRVPVELDPLKDGYCLVRSQKQEALAEAVGSDYNIIHCKWQLTYKIDDAERFFRNIYIEDVKPGQGYAEVIETSISPLLQGLFEDAVVTAIVNYTIDQALFLSQDRITGHIEKLLQEKLDKIQSGINVVSVQLTDSTWPRQVDSAFLASLRASQASQKAISEAKGYAEKTLNEAAGPVAEELLASFEKKDISEVDSTGSPQDEQELLWSQLAGEGREIIAEAKAYRTKTVESAKANAEYLQKILPEYQKRPKLVIQDIYQEAIEYVLNNADEKMIIQPAKGIKGKELRVLINKDPAIKPKSEEK
jgi:regulator of protease activity HflC (stomatin/prohibitin superfamily)